MFANWQLQMFRKTLKKQLRLSHIRKILDPVPPDAVCLLLTCGDNNGAINYYLAQSGGKWSWADVEGSNIGEMSELLGQEVHLASSGHLPFPDESFDVVISIDVHEHVESPVKVTRELHRVAKSGGRVLITVPGGDPSKLVNRLKSLIGMTKEKYGHVRDGFSVSEVQEIMRSSEISPESSLTFSKFFTELVELGINYTYMNILAGKGGDGDHGPIAPQSSSDLDSVKSSYRAYSLVYPIIWLFSRLDVLLFFSSGYVVMVVGRKS